MIYLDNAASSPISEAAVKRMEEVSRLAWGNPASGHNAGRLAGEILKNARLAIADLMGAAPGEVYFTSGGTESNNLAIIGAAKRPGRIITSQAEHPSVLECFKKLSNKGFDVVYLTLSREGKIDPEELCKAIDDKTVLVSLVHVNNETGVITDLETMGKIIKDRNKNTLFHTDAVQSFGKHPLDIRKCRVDMVSVTAHKLHGPKGIGAVFVRSGLHLAPMLCGGGQQGGLRPGTENPVAAAAFATAAQEAFGGMDSELARIADIRERIVGITSAHEEVCINGEETSPYIINMSFLGIPSEVMQNALDAEGICVSSGAACAEGKNKRSRNVPEVYGLGRKRADSAVRVSLGRQNTAEEAEAFVQAVSRLITSLSRGRRH